MTTNQIGKLIKSSRGKRSYYAIAAKAQTTIKIIQNIENGGKCTLCTFVRVAKAVDLDLSLTRIPDQDQD